MPSAARSTQAQAAAAAAPATTTKETPEQKRSKRLARNRISAQLHRERQRINTENLEAAAAALREEAAYWRQRAEAMEALAQASGAAVPPRAPMPPPPVVLPEPTMEEVAARMAEEERQAASTGGKPARRTGAAARGKPQRSARSKPPRPAARKTAAAVSSRRSTSPKAAVAPAAVAPAAVAPAAVAPAAVALVAKAQKRPLVAALGKDADSGVDDSRSDARSVDTRSVGARSEDAAVFDASVSPQQAVAEADAALAFSGTEPVPYYGLQEQLPPDGDLFDDGRHLDDAVAGPAAARSSVLPSHDLMGMGVSAVAGGGRLDVDSSMEALGIDMPFSALDGPGGLGVDRMDSIDMAAAAAAAAQRRPRPGDNDDDSDTEETHSVGSSTLSQGRSSGGSSATPRAAKAARTGEDGTGRNTWVAVGGPLFFGLLFAVVLIGGGSSRFGMRLPVVGLSGASSPSATQHHADGWLSGALADSYYLLPSSAQDAARGRGALDGDVAAMHHGGRVLASVDSADDTFADDTDSRSLVLANQQHGTSPASGASKDVLTRSSSRDPPTVVVGGARDRPSDEELASALATLAAPLQMRATEMRRSYLDGVELKDDGRNASFSMCPQALSVFNGGLANATRQSPSNDARSPSGALLTAPPHADGRGGGLPGAEMNDYMLLLVPASSLQQGSSASEGWAEIGCNVVHARHLRTLPLGA